MLHENRAFIQTESLPPLAPPINETGVAGWIKRKLFGSFTDGLATILILAVLVLALPPAFRWLVIDATWTGKDRTACVAPIEQGIYGACWAFIRARTGVFIYGTYPLAERWRVDLTFWIGVVGLFITMTPKVPGKKIATWFLLLAYPVIAFVLLTGGAVEFGLSTKIIFGGIVAVWAGLNLWSNLNAKRGPKALVQSLAGPAWAGAVGLAITSNFGLAWVETPLWGGMLVTLVVSIVGNLLPLPIGIAWALGRRSKMPIIKAASIFCIEVFRGVPLITVLFMSSVMLPLFLPPDVHIDKLFRALVGITLFSAAYMAEIVRGGLQALPKGQYEAADALGLSYWNALRLIILPQALKIAIPNLVNNFVGLLQNTSLVSIIGVFDLLGVVSQGMQDQNWSGPTTPATGLIFAAFVFWVMCFAISRYSMYLERRLDTARRH